MGNRKETEDNLIAAVETLIAREGMNALGINAIAREAGVNKSLIYRYFDNLKGLLHAFAASQNFWPNLGETLGPNPESLFQKTQPEILSSILRNHCEALVRRPLTIEILAQECVEQNELTKILEEVREDRSRELFGFLKAHQTKTNLSNAQLQAVFASGALFIGALQYFLVRGRFVKIFGGLDIKSKSGREKIYKLIELLTQNLDA